MPNAKRPREDDNPHENMIIDLDEQISPREQAPPIERNGLDITSMEILFNKLLGPIKAEIENIHDRLYNICTVPAESRPTTKFTKNSTKFTKNSTL